MKVLHIIKTATGATWAYHQIRVLRALGVEVVVALPSDTEGLARRYREASVRVIGVNLDFPAKRPWELRGVLAACRNVVQSVAPDLIHTHHVGTTLVARLALGKESAVPRVFQVAGPLHLESEFFAKLDVGTAGPRDHWIATCQWIRRRYAELGIEPDRVFLSYLGEDVHPFTDAPALRESKLRTLAGISREVPLVGMIAYAYAPKWFLGQGRGLKGHEDFMAALNLAREELPGIRGVIIGGAWGNAGWYEDRLRYLGQATCDGSLEFLGTRRDIPDLLRDLDLVVIPSHSENCGPAIEPLLSGVPVIASNVGGIPDLVHEGETGWLVPPQNPAVLARTIVEALRDRNEMRRRGMQGQKLAAKFFDVQRTAREVAGAYEIILRRFGPGRDRGNLPATSMPMPNMYTDGSYARKHASWHVEDSGWKAQQVLKILHRNSIVPKTIADVGCGAGEVIRRVSVAFPDAQCRGFEISPDAFELARARQAKNLSYHLCDVLEFEENFEVVLLMDVIEHIEDCFGFLRSVRQRTRYLVAHIPLDLSALSLLIDTPMANRRSAGHLHYFTRTTALALLADTGYRIVDWFHPVGAHFLPKKGSRTRLIASLRAAAERIAPGVSALLLGGSSIVVLAD